MRKEDYTHSIFKQINYFILIFFITISIKNNDLLVIYIVKTGWKYRH